MKKLLFIIVSFVMYFSVCAQTYNLSLDANTTYKLISTDYTVTNTTAANFIFQAANNFTCTQDYLIQLDSLSGNHTNVSVTIYGAKFATSAYSAIGSTVNWKKTTSDTTIIISNATANRYRYYKVVVIGTGVGTSKVDSQELKLYQE